MTGLVSRVLRAANLTRLTLTAVVHILRCERKPGTYCLACNSLMMVKPDGRVSIVAPHRPCPCHVAFRELTRKELPIARTSR